MKKKKDFLFVSAGILLASIGMWVVNGEFPTSFTIYLFLIVVCTYLFILE